MPVYRVNKITHLDKFTKCYINIFSINNAPNDISLNNITKIMPREKLSHFQAFQNCCETSHCLKVFVHKNTQRFIKENEIDVLFSQLIDEGFTIDYKMSKLIKDKNFICFIVK